MKTSKTSFEDFLDRIPGIMAQNPRHAETASNPTPYGGDTRESGAPSSDDEFPAMRVPVARAGRWPSSLLLRVVAAVLLCAGLGGVLGGWVGKKAEANERERLTKVIDSLNAELLQLGDMIKRLGFDRALQFDGSPFQVNTRNQLKVSVRFDARYIKSIKYRWSDSESFQPLYDAANDSPKSETIVERSQPSNAFALSGDVITAELQVEVVDDPAVQKLIPLEERSARRSFALTPMGITADPPDLAEVPVDRISNEHDPMEPNRYSVRGRLPRNQTSRLLPARSYLVITPELSDNCVISDVIVPASDGRFFVKCYLGTRLDEQRYMLKVISYYGSGKEAPSYAAGDAFSKDVAWETKGFQEFGGNFKVNNGKDGFND